MVADGGGWREILWLKKGHFETNNTHVCMSKAMVECWLSRRRTIPNRYPNVPMLENLPWSSYYGTGSVALSLITGLVVLHTVGSSWQLAAAAPLTPGGTQKSGDPGDYRGPPNPAPGFLATMAERLPILERERTEPFTSALWRTG